MFFNLFRKKESVPNITVSIEMRENTIDLPDFQDKRKAECPYCNKELKKVPGAKTKCPYCSEYMFVRTGPDNVRLVVTEAQADEIDEQWRIVNGTQEMYLAESKRVEERRAQLKKQFGGKEPSEHDVQWGLLNEDIMNHASNGQWGLYRNTRMQMADLLWKEKRHKGALQMYCMVCYLDLNGANNMLTDENGRVITDIEGNEPFDVELKFLAPGITDRIRKAVEILGMSKEEFKELFIDRATIEQRGSRAPITPLDCTEELIKDIYTD
jgi:hypothetical protein